MSVIAPGRNIVLIGLMGVGKSTVGRIVADRLGRPFVDTDAVVEAEVGRAISEIFAEEGERAFRAHEAAAIRHVAALRGQVVAVGGGAVVDPGNATQLRGTGDLVWLDAPTDVLLAQLGPSIRRGDRPLLGGPEEVRAVLDRLRRDRHRAYADAAAHTIQTAGRHPEVVADEVIAWAWTRPGLLAREERQ